MEVQWKELLTCAATEEDDQVEDSQEAELHCYFLGDKKIFDGRKNVKSHHLGGALLEEWTGAAYQTGECDPSGACGIGPDEVDPG